MKLCSYSPLLVISGFLATLGTAHADTLWSFDLGATMTGRGLRCGLTLSKSETGSDAFITVAQLGTELTLIVKQAGTIYPEGPDVVYKLVWTGAPGSIWIGMRPAAHAFLLSPINFKTDPLGRLPQLLQTPSTISIATNTSADVYTVSLPPVPRALGLRQVSCLRGRGS